MINLIPYELKESKRYAKRSAHLLRYSFILTSLIVCIVVLGVATLVAMQQKVSNLNDQIETQNLELAKIKKVETEGQRVSDLVTTIDQLLKREVRFSSVIPAVAQNLPPGSALSGISLDSATISGQSISATKTTTKTTTAPYVEISVKMQDRIQASVVLQNIRSVKNVFSSADLISLEVLSDDKNGGYPVKALFRAYINQTEVTTNSGAAKQ